MNAMQFLEAAVSVSLQAGIVVLAAGMLLKSRRLSAQATCRLWTWAHVLILGLTIVAATFPHLRLLTPRSVAAAAAVSSVQVRQVIGQVLLAVWLAGAVVSTISLLAGWWSIIRSIRRSRSVDPAVLAPPDSDDAAALDVGGLDVALRAAPRVSGPCCWQLHRPYILLPEKLLAVAPRQLQFIVRHEHAHLRLGHPLQLFLQRMVEILFWFHPLIWWSARQAGIAREFACDEAAARTRNEIADYLRTLLAVVEQTRDLREPCRQMLGFGAGASVIARRAQRLVQLAKSASAPHESVCASRLRCAALCLCAVACASVWLPVNGLASSRSWWSPWPSWSAALAGDLGLPARDYEVFDPRSQLFELEEEALGGASASSAD